MATYNIKIQTDLAVISYNQSSVLMVLSILTLKTFSFFMLLYSVQHYKFTEQTGPIEQIRDCLLSSIGMDNQFFCLQMNACILLIVIWIYRKECIHKGTGSEQGIKLCCIIFTEHELLHAAWIFLIHLCLVWIISRYGIWNAVVTKQLHISSGNFNYGELYDIYINAFCSCILYKQEKQISNILWL